MAKGSTGQVIKKMIATIVVIEIICLSLGFSLGVISSVIDMSDLCFKRYSFDSLNSNSITSNVTINATANYTISETAQGASLAADPATAGYGRWQRANFQIKPNQLIQVKASGEISLCRAYLPKYHLQTPDPLTNSSGIYYTRANGNKISIPRTNENTDPLTLIFDARTRGWRNLTEVYNGDIVKVILDDNVSPSQVIAPDGTIVPVSAADCNSLTDATARQNCLTGLNANQPTNFNAGDCSTIADPTQRASCQAQFGGNPPPPSGMSRAECQRLPPNLVAQCINNIPSGAPAPPPPPAPVPTGQNVNVSAYTVTDSITNTPTVANCSQNNRTYSPICGRFSLWNGTTIYHINCTCGHHANRCGQYECDRRCTNWTGGCNAFCMNWAPVYCRHQCRSCGTTIMPETYLDNGSRTKSRFTNQNFMLQDYSADPAGSITSCDAEPSYPTRFWFSASDASGLQYRFTNNVFPGSAALGGNYQWASIVNPAADVYNDQYDGRKIYSDQFDSAPFAYMQFRFHGADYSTTQTGGYVLKLLQTKCRRLNGNYLTDTLENRGAVEYVILPNSDDPNVTPSLAASPQRLNFVNGITNMNSGNQEGYMWLRIKNNMADYPDSSGTYRITLETQVNYGSFTLQILNPLFKIFRDKVYDLAIGTFENITCYQTTLSDSCINFFNYLRALLTLYIMFLGFRFLLGANIKHEELVKSILKIVVIIGLMNGGTFEFFRENIFPLITGFSDQIIANMSGFSMISSTNSIENPFMFLDALMSKMFLNPTFLFQLLTTMAMGITGIFYFLIICVSVLIFIMSIFRAMAIYIMALLATALLIGVAPIFISFVLFDRTYYLFENWAKFTFRYMMEPVIVMAGIIILTQLFTLYIDQVLSYSLCWKCALPFKIPFASLLPFPGLANIPLFCIYWFSPWGLDPVNDPMGLDLSMIVGLAMVAYSAYGYVEFAGKIATRLVGGSGGPSSISLGTAMNKDFGSKVQEEALLAQDKYAKTLDKKGADKKGPNRDGPTMGPAGEGDEGGGSDGDSGALKSNRDDGSALSTPADSVADASSGGDAASDSAGDSAPAQSDTSSGDAGGDSSSGDSSSSEGSSAGTAAREGLEAALSSDDEGPKTAEEQQQEQEEKREEERVEDLTEREEARIESINREREIAAAAAASEAASSESSLAGPDDAEDEEEFVEGGEEAVEDEEETAAEEEAGTSGAGSEDKPDGEENAGQPPEEGQTTQEFLDSFGDEKRQELDTNAVEDMKNKGSGKGSMND